MKRILPLALLLALPLGAEEPRATSETTAPKSKEAVSTVPATGDSPLVALSKRANRKGKKSAHAITNESLKRAAGSNRITTTETQTPVTVPSTPPAPTPEMVAASEAAARRIAAEKRDAEARRKEEGAQQRAASVNERYEDDYLDDAEAEADAARIVKAAREAESKPPGN